MIMTLILIFIFKLCSHFITIFITISYGGRQSGLGTSLQDEQNESQPQGLSSHEESHSPPRNQNIEKQNEEKKRLSRHPLPLEVARQLRQLGIIIVNDHRFQLTLRHGWQTGRRSPWSSQKMLQQNNQLTASSQNSPTRSVAHALPQIKLHRYQKTNSWTHHQIQSNLLRNDAWKMSSRHVVHAIPRLAPSQDTFRKSKLLTT